LVNALEIGKTYRHSTLPVGPLLCIEEHKDSNDRLTASMLDIETGEMRLIYTSSRVILFLTEV